MFRNFWGRKYFPCYSLNFLSRFRSALRQKNLFSNRLLVVTTFFPQLLPKYFYGFSSIGSSSGKLEMRIWKHVWLNYQNLLPQELVSVFVKLSFFPRHERFFFFILMYTFASIKLFLLLLDIVVNVLFHTATLQHAAFFGIEKKEKKKKTFPI